MTKYNYSYIKDNADIFIIVIGQIQTLGPDLRKTRHRSVVKFTGHNAHTGNKDVQKC